MTPQERLIVAKDQLERMKAGERVITNDETLAAMLDVDDDSWKLVRSMPNPRRLGLRDQYEAWIGDRERRCAHCGKPENITMHGHGKQLAFTDFAIHSPVHLDCLTAYLAAQPRC